MKLTYKDCLLISKQMVKLCLFEAAYKLFVDTYVLVLYALYIIRYMCVSLLLKI